MPHLRRDEKTVAKIVATLIAARGDLIKRVFEFDS